MARGATLAVTLSSGHERHHVRDKGYVESPRRLPAIQRGFNGLAIEPRLTQHFPDSLVTRVHSKRLVNFIRSSCKRIAEGKYEYPYILPVRRLEQPPREWDLAIGYYCIDTFTPIHRDAYVTARHAVDSAVTAADALLKGSHFSYSLVRPPGHHAEHDLFGGFCYLNSSAVAAEYLSASGRVAMLDIDYHHGNGQQDIFWRRRDVLTVSIHADPRYAYPYFSGYAEEAGDGEGRGYNVNLPLPDKRDGAQYRHALRKAIGIVRDFDPDYIVVPLGFDPARNDPTGSWMLDAIDFFENGKLIRTLERPTVFVQEGGYRIGTLGKNTQAFFGGVLGAS